MPRPSASTARLSPEAEADLENILEWSETHFGPGAAARYSELVIQALCDLQADPHRPSARHRPELQQGVFSYHLANSRDAVTGDRVKAPRHFILYRPHSEGTLEVIRILHDSRDLARHLPSGD